MMDNNTMQVAFYIFGAVWGLFIGIVMVKEKSR